MARMKRGAKLGKVDCAYNEIRVGDTIRNKHTDAEYEVTPYGSLDNGKGLLTKWDPDDYRVVRTRDEALKEEHEAKKAEEERIERLNSTAEEIAEEPVDDPLGIVAEEMQAPAQAEEVKEAASDAAQIDTPFSDIVKAKEMVSELRSMGFTVTCTKSVFVEL